MSPIRLVLLSIAMLALSITSIPGLPGVASAQFADGTVGPLGDTALSNGVAWGDYDNDGDLDLYVSNIGYSNRLFRNDGGLTWAYVSVGTTLADPGNGEGVAWGDYDNDGDLDLYLANWGSANKLFRNDGGGSFADVTSAPLDDPGKSSAAAWADFDNDGDLDLYLANWDTANKLLRNDGGGTFVDATSGPLGDISYDVSVAWADFDNDGDLDLYVAKSCFQANLLFRNDGGGTFTDATSGPLGDTGCGGGVAWGDYDNDGDLDLYLANAGSIPNKLLRNDGGGTFVDATSGLLGDLGSGMGVGWGDYDNDGDLDLYLVNYYSSSNKLFRNDGGGTFADVTSYPLDDNGPGLGVAWGDCDNDGDLDLYLARGDEETLWANKLFVNSTSPSQQWLQVKLQGTVSNRSGIGARVKLVADGVIQIREISGGGGYHSQDALVASFGLWSASSVDSLVVRWPSGIVQAVPLEGNPSITVVESSGPAAVGDAPVAFALQAAVPNPFTGRTAIDFTLPRASAAWLAVYDVTGRRVRVLAEGTRAAGRHTVAWDGTDGNGHRLGAGVYLYRLRVDGFTATRRVVLMP